MEICEIRSRQLSFRSGTLSAEHVSLRFLDEDIDYVWQPRPGHWEHGSFLCFPLLGRLPEGRYCLDGRTYDMPMHGFAQHEVFAVTERHADRVTYELTANERTRAMYPFDFALRVRYTLSGASLEITYEVENRDERALPFSIGGHPGFTCPLLPGEAFSDYELVFDREEQLSHVVTFYSPMEVLERAFGRSGKILPLSYNLFRDGSICFRPIASGQVTLRSRKSGRGIRLSLDGADCFQIWTAPGSPFLAMEAWHGAITRRDRPRQDVFREREGTLLLPPGETYVCRHTVTPLR